MTRAIGLLSRRAFDPASLSPNLWLKGGGTYWQDSARTTPATADGDPVGAWDDASGNARHSIQATSGLRPVLKTGGNGVNSISTVRFDGVDDYLNGPVSTLTAHRLFVVIKKRAAASATSQVAFSYAAAGNAPYVDTATGTGPGYNYRQNQAAAKVSIGGTVTNWNIIFISWASLSAMTIRINGGSGVGPFDPDDSFSNNTSLFLGTNNSFAAGDYDIAEVFRSPALSVANADNVGNYLADKYNLGWSAVT